jgi:ribosomal protein S18 acetylase RimI-like enzyme
MYDGSPLYTCVACAVRSDIESPSCLGIDAIRIKDAWAQLWKVLQVDGLYDEPIIFKNVVKYSESNKNDDPSSSDENESNERIVGCLIGRFIDNPSEENKTLLISDPTRHTTLFYVMTLGVIDNFRKSGLATVLVERAIRLAQQVTSCSAIYLHVITYNTPAIQFYEKLGFRRITELKGAFTYNVSSHGFIQASFNYTFLFRLLQH